MDTCYLVFLVLWACLLASVGATDIHPSGENDTFTVVSYLPEWRYEHADWESIAEFSTHILLFSLEPSEKGEILARDRLPSKRLMKVARETSRRHGTLLLVCFGGNGRSAGFSAMTRDTTARRLFIKRLAKLMDELELDGVDYNWEYPGYRFGSGYMSDAEVMADYQGLANLVKETKSFLRKKNRKNVVTLAYYPDSRQEQLIKQFRIDEEADLMHMMSYDQGGRHHSSLAYGQASVDQGRRMLPAQKLTMGLPFYGRSTGTGDWATYEDLVRDYDPLSPELDEVPDKKGNGMVGFNGVRTVEKKTLFALENGLSGVMIWEVGQDCRLRPPERRTCPKEDSSLLRAITLSALEFGRKRLRSPDWGERVSERRNGEDLREL